MSSFEEGVSISNAVKSGDTLVGVKLFRDGNCRSLSGDRLAIENSGAQENAGNLDIGNDCDCIGLVVTPLSVKLDELRAVMVTQIPAQLPQQFEFLMANSFPVMEEQESVIELQSIVESESYDRRPVVTIRQIFTGDSRDAPSPPSRTTETSGPSVSGAQPTNTANNYVMISYVRNEALVQAVQIQRALASMGVTAFLDVNDIRTAVKWDITLNEAVRGCRLFVALVTARYGDTKWTHRELSLADKMNARVVLINFLDRYPPGIVAIYFSCLQHYTPAYKLPAGRGKSADYWEESFAEPTAKEIEKIYIEELNNPGPSSAALNNRSTFNQQFTATRTASGDCVSAPLPVEPLIQRPLVVISAHPALSGFVELLKEVFHRLAIDAWSSTDICINERNLRRSRAPQIDLDSPAVSEGDRYLRELYIQAATTSGDEQQRLYALIENARESLKLPPQFGLHMLAGDRLTVERRKAFLESAKMADAMVVLVSSEYAKSMTSKQQAYYCSLKERVLAVLFDPIEPPPKWLAMFSRSMACVSQDTDDETLATNIGETMRAMLETSADDQTADETSVYGDAEDTLNMRDSEA